MATTVTLKPNAIDLSGSTSGTTTLQANAVAGTTTVTLPAATDTLVGKATTDTLTNKTLTSPTLSAPVLGTPASGLMTNVTGLPLTTGVTGTLPVANGGTGVTTSTGTGANVLGTSPTIATPTMTGQATIPTINLTGGQIAFPATQSESSDANTLDDYEEGSFTATLLISGVSTGITQTSSVGSYVKVGCLVTCAFQISLSNKGSNTGQVQLVLPFAQRNQADLFGNCFLYAASLASDCRSTSLQLSSNSATVTFLKGLGSTAADSALGGGDCTNSSSFRASFSYISNF